MLRRNIFNASETTLGFFRHHPQNIWVQSEGEHWAARRAAGTPSYCCSLKQNTQLEEGGSSSTWKEELKLEQAVQFKKSSRLLVCSCLFSRLQGLSRIALNPVAFLWHYWFCIIACTLGNSSWQVPQQLGAQVPLFIGAPFHFTAQTGFSPYFYFCIFCVSNVLLALCGPEGSSFSLTCALCWMYLKQLLTSLWSAVVRVPLVPHKITILEHQPLDLIVRCVTLFVAAWISTQRLHIPGTDIKLDTSVIKTGKEVEENMD